MRIQDGNPARTQASQTEKASDSQEIARRHSDGLLSTGLGGGDRVDLSTLADRLSGALDSAEGIARTERLAKEYQAGRYTIDSRELSRTLIAEALQSGEGGSRINFDNGR